MLNVGIDNSFKYSLCNFNKFHPSPIHFQPAHSANAFSVDATIDNLSIQEERDEVDSSLAICSEQMDSSLSHIMVGT